MDVYPAELEPTRTMPDSMTAADERAAGYFGDVFWPAGYKGRAELLKLLPIRRMPRHEAPATPPVTFVDRETGQELRKPTTISRIGHWNQSNAKRSH